MSHYGLGADRVLKVYADAGQRATVETLQDFYARLTADAVPFALGDANTPRSPC